MVLNQKSGCYTKTQPLMQTLKNILHIFRFRLQTPPKLKNYESQKAYQKQTTSQFLKWNPRRL